MGLTRDCPRRLRISSFLLLCRFALLGQWEMGPAALPPDLLGGARPLWGAPASDAPALRRWEGFSGPRGCGPLPVGALSGRGPAGRAAATASATPRPLELLWPRAPSLPASGPPLCFWPNPGLLPAPASAFLRRGLRLDGRRAHPNIQPYPGCCERPRPARSLLGSRQRSGLPPLLQLCSSGRRRAFRALGSWGAFHTWRSLLGGASLAAEPEPARRGRGRRHLRGWRA